jgi:ribosomal protein S18 acetylase RimI-like enzyme
MQEILIADYANEFHAAAIVNLMNAYAMDRMGGAEALPESVKQTLVSEMAKVPNAFTVLSLVNGKPAGLINCFMGFSTFKAKPLINIHDIVVISDYRGLQLSQLMLDKVEEIARTRNCCKLTLEVLTGNTVARSAYVKFGFGAYELDPETGGAIFWQKAL